MAGPANPEGTNASEDIFLCMTAADYDALGSRTIIASLLRQQLEASAITPSELLYGPSQLRQVTENQAVLEAVLWRAATVQGRLPGQEPQARLVQLRSALESVFRRARASELVLAELPAQRSASTAYLARKITDSAKLGPALARAVVARDLATLTGWPAKFEYLIGLIWQQSDEQLHQAVDEYLGDVLAFPAATRALMPQRSTTGAVLERLLGLIEGRLAPDAGPLDRFSMLVPLFKQNRLPTARSAVIDRIRRQLKGSEPLGAGQSLTEEAELLKPLTFSLLTATGVLGGTAMAEALTRRHARTLKESGSRGMRRALSDIAASLNDLPICVHYLSALCSPDLAPALGDEAIASLEAACDRPSTLDSLVLTAPDPAAARATLAHCAATLSASRLPATERAGLAARLERLIDESTVSGTLIARLQTTEPAIARQAWRLSELVGSGAVSDPRALTAVRRHLFTLLRQPGFNDELSALKSGTGGAAIDLQRFRSVLGSLTQMVDSNPVTQQKPKPKPVMPDLSDMTIRQPDLADMTIRQPDPAEMTIFQPRQPGPSPAQAPQAKATLPPTAPPLATVAPMPAAASPPVSRTKSTEDSRCPNCFVQKSGPPDCPDCGYTPGTSENSPVLLVPGTWLLGRYRTGKLLGQGGFGATYLGWDDRLQIRVAIKEYFPTNLVSREIKGTALVPFTPDSKKTFTNHCNCNPFLFTDWHFLFASRFYVLSKAKKK